MYLWIVWLYSTTYRLIKARTMRMTYTWKLSCHLTTCSQCVWNMSTSSLLCVFSKTVLAVSSTNCYTAINVSYVQGHTTLWTTPQKQSTTNTYTWYRSCMTGFVVVCQMLPTACYSDPTTPILAPYKPRLAAFKIYHLTEDLSHTQIISYSKCWKAINDQACL